MSRFCGGMVITGSLITILFLSDLPKLADAKYFKGS